MRLGSIDSVALVQPTPDFCIAEEQCGHSLVAIFSCSPWWRCSILLLLLSTALLRVAAAGCIFRHQHSLWPRFSNSKRSSIASKHRSSSSLREAHVVFGAAVGISLSTSSLGKAVTMLLGIRRLMFI
uniref:Uncharacterized protein n=1 Tax=Physcomitrium patens TaxID=3218 RepID=A0A2K1JDX9_PHYPA|nr:hypothetical protein PHYPA_020011 [Physcomitrium patens]